MTMDLDECLLDNDRLRHGLRLANTLPDADGLAAQIHTRLPDLLFKFDMLQTNLLTHDRIDAPATARCCARSYLDCGLCCAVIPTFQTHKCCVGRVGNLAKYRLISVISTRYTLASSRASISRLSRGSTKRSAHLVPTFRLMCNTLCKAQHITPNATHWLCQCAEHRRSATHWPCQCAEHYRSATGSRGKFYQVHGPQTQTT
jgi:hypothetical protein